MHRPLLPMAAVLLLALAGCSSDEAELRQNLDAAVVGEEDPAEVRVPVEASGELIDPEGSAVGGVWFRDTDLGTEVEVEVSGLAPGLHPMYLSAVGACETDSGDEGVTGPFLSAGDVVRPLPAVLVLQNGVGATTTLAGPVTLEELLEGDGTALVVTEPAGTPPPPAPGDQDQAEGSDEDIGSRVACGAVVGADL